MSTATLAIIAIKTVEDTYAQIQKNTAHKRLNRIGRCCRGMFPRTSELRYILNAALKCFKSPD